MWQETAGSCVSGLFVSSSKTTRNQSYRLTLTTLSGPNHLRPHPGCLVGFLDFSYHSEPDDGDRVTSAWAQTTASANPCAHCMLSYVQSMFTLCLVYVHCIFIYVHCMFTLCIFTVCSLYVHCIQSMFTVCSLCSLYVQSMFTVCSLCSMYVQSMFTVCSLCSLYIQSMFTVCSLYVHSAFILCSLYAHSMLTVCPAYFYSMFTVCSLCVHCMNISQVVLSFSRSQPLSCVNALYFLQ